MKLLKYILLCLVISTISLSAQSGYANFINADSADKVPKMIRENITDFFTIMFDGNYEKAYQKILEKSPLINDKENLDKLIKETAKIDKFYGKLTEFEFCKTEIVTKSYIRISCLGLCSKHPMRWVFTYYHSPELGWLVTNIKFDDLTEKYFMEKE
jgi:hypothetical protein